MPAAEITPKKEHYPIPQDPSLLMGVDAFYQSNTAKMQRRTGSRQGTGELYYKI